MADLRPTTKARAKRIELEYFKRSHPLRRAKFVLSIAAPALAALWVLAGAVQGDQRLYTSGPVSTAHFMFDAACAECHQPTTLMGAPKPGGRSYFVKATNVACERCHAGPVHHDAQVVPAALRETGTDAQRCATCHVEHEGHVVLADLGPAHCTSCHAGLETKPDARPRFQARVTDFGTDHPEFAVRSDDGRAERVRLNDKTPPRDPTQLNLNHRKHLKVGLRDVDKVKGKPGVLERDGQLQLGCTFCHRTDARGATIQPVSYQEHCATCHALEVDGKVPGAQAPHEEPPIVHASLRMLYVEAYEQCRAGTPEADAVKKGWCEKLQLTAAAPAAAPPAGAAPPADGESRGRLLRRPEGGAEPEKQEKPEEGDGAPRRLRRGGASLDLGDRVRLAHLGTTATRSDAPAELDLLGLLRRAAAPPADRPGPMLAQGRLLRGAPAEESKPEAPADAPRRLRRGGDEPKEEPAPSEGGGRRLLRGGGAEAPAAEAPRAAAAPARAPGAAALAWADEQLPRIEKRIFGQCAECHVKQDGEERAVPVYKKTAMPGPRRLAGPADPSEPRWLPHSVFDHGVHRPVSCTGCHARAKDSEDKADVLLPSIGVCRECHAPTGGARTTCVECHLYHDKTKERDMSGPFDVRQLTRRAPAPAAPAGGVAPGPSK
jgi:hypothetical protein